MRAHRTRVGAALRLAVAGLALAAGACRTATPVAGTADRPTFVLVHGAFQDASAWARVGPLLEARGHRVVAVDLPAHGRDTTPLGRATLAGYRDAVVDVIDRQPGPVVLVGHSFGGIVISAVAEAVPEKVRTLVYVAAYLPADGESLVALSQRDTANSFTQQNFVVAADQGYADVLEADRVKIFCADCSAADAERIRAGLRREPLAPLATPVRLTAERFGRVDKVYVETLRDEAVSHPLQRTMLARTPVRRSVALETSHAPFLTMPDRLAEALLTLAASTR